MRRRQTKLGANATAEESCEERKKRRQSKVVLAFLASAVALVLWTGPAKEAGKTAVLWTGTAKGDGETVLGIAQMKQKLNEENTPSPVVDEMEKKVVEFRVRGEHEKGEVIEIEAVEALQEGPTEKEKVKTARPEYIRALSEKMRIRCEDFALADSSKKQICCTNAIRSFCIPNLVVIGAQKGGTTAIHSYLMLHEDLQPSTRKELHIWDTDRNFISWTNVLQKNFHNRVGTQVSFESTPSYIASPLACQRMSSWLSPWTTFVIILRDPVKRFWSEYNMKMRRIENQDAIMNSVLQNKEAVLNCFEKERNLRYTLRSMRESSSKQEKFISEKLQSECWDPLFGSSHGLIQGSSLKLNQIKAALSRELKQSDQADVKSFTNSCLRTSLTSIEEYRLCFQKFGMLKELLPPLPKVLLEEKKTLEECTSGIEMAPYDVETTGYMSSGIALNQSACLHRIFTEWCPRCQEGNGDCLKKCFQSGSTELHEAHRLGCAIPIDDNPYPRSDLIKISSCEGPTCACFPKSRSYADISKNYLWRGLYYPQIATCLRHIPKDQLVILENEDLRSDVNGTLNKIFARAGLPLINFDKYSWSDAETLFDLKYPDFESVTGWAVDGSSGQKMPDHVKAMLEEFYRIPNERLFNLIGKRFDHWSGTKRVP